MTVSVPLRVEDEAEPDALRGVRVLEVAEFPAVSVAGKLLAQMGADVVKVETGSRSSRAVSSGPWRRIFDYQNAGKRSLAARRESVLRSSLVERLRARSHIVLWDAAEHPIQLGNRARSTTAQGRVELSIGVESSQFDQPSTEFTRYHGRGTAQLVPAEPGVRPAMASRHFWDYASGVNIVIAVLAAHWERIASCDNSIVEIDASDLANGVWIERGYLTRAINEGVTYTSATQRYPYGGNVKSSDGWVMLFAMEDHQFAKLARLIGAEEWTRDPEFSSGFARRRHASEIQQRIEDWAAVRTTQEILANARQHDVISARVQRPIDLRLSQDLRRRGFIVDRDPDVALRLPYGRGFPTAAASKAPLHGEHSVEIMRELGYSDDEIAAAQATESISTGAA